MKSIVVALDGSACADEAFDYALGLAQTRGTKLEICSVVDPVAILGRNPARPLRERHVAAAKVDLERTVREAVAKAEARGVDADGRVLLGDPAAQIVERAAAVEAEAIVIGTHGCSGFKRLFIGGVAREVLRSASSRVVLVREQAGAARRAPRSRPAETYAGTVSVLRLIEVAPKNFETLYNRIAAFMNGAGKNLSGVVRTELLGAFDGTRILILAEFRSHRDWVRAQWDARLGGLLEEIAAGGQTLEFGLYHGDRFEAAAVSELRTAAAVHAGVR